MLTRSFGKPIHSERSSVTINRNGRIPNNTSQGLYTSLTFLAQITLIIDGNNSTQSTVLLIVMRFIACPIVVSILLTQVLF